MVVIHVKTAEEKNTFFYETKCEVQIKLLISELVFLHNRRLKILELAEACEGLAKFGPLRPEETRGLTEEVAKLSGLDVNSYGTPAHPDPSGYRCGVPPSPEAVKTLQRTAEEAKKYVSEKKVITRETLSRKDLTEEFQKLKGAVMIAYPDFNRLPVYDPAHQILSESDEDSLKSKPELNLESTSLWWAGREMLADEKLETYVRKNEKTRITVNLYSKSAGAPAREPRICEETHRAMLDYAHRKRREEEELEKDEDDSYLESEWANPKSLRDSLVNGGRNIKYKP